MRNSVLDLLTLGCPGDVQVGVSKWNSGKGSGQSYKFRGGGLWIYRYLRAGIGARMESKDQAQAHATIQKLGR